MGRGRHPSALGLGACFQIQCQCTRPVYMRPCTDVPAQRHATGLMFWSGRRANRVLCCKTHVPVLLSPAMSVLRRRVIPACRARGTVTEPSCKQGSCAAHVVDQLESRHAVRASEASSLSGDVHDLERAPGGWCEAAGCSRTQPDLLQSPHRCASGHLRVALVSCPWTCTHAPHSRVCEHACVQPCSRAQPMRGSALQAAALYTTADVGLPCMTLCAAVSGRRPG